jgi:hypothetical protein
MAILLVVGLGARVLRTLDAGGREGRTLTWKPKRAAGVVGAIEYGKSTLKGLLVTHGGPFSYCARGGVHFTKFLRRRRRRPDLSEAPFAPRGRPRPLAFNIVQPELSADAILLNVCPGG